MDVRCERCQTEYELDDASVSDEGTAVQCTACGHTFQVTPRQIPVVPAETEESPPTAEWLLETVEGPVHRFRSLTSLQKWIVERKATREDRISRTGHAWRRLGEIVELVPFFELVDEADRARASASTQREQKEVAEKVHRATEAVRRTATHRAADAGAEPEHHTDVVRRRGRGAVRIGIMLGVATLVAYVGISEVWRKPMVRFWMTRLSLTPPAPPAVAVAAPPSAPVEALPSTPDSAAIAVAPADAGPEAAVAAAEPADKPAEKPPEVSYEKAVADADHLLETGHGDKARLLYRAALQVKPGAPEALAGLGYVALDRGRTGLALSFFKRALSSNSSFGPALFGLAETQRALGQDDHALENYRRYVGADPRGEDVQAARRHIHMLEAQAAQAPAAPDAPPPAP
jgi:predicted Zn finger-like uncharacterized protein